MSAIGSAVAQATVPSKQDDLLLVQLARQIAMDISPVDKILIDLGIADGEWEAIQRNTRFQQLLRASIEEWNSSDNTAERTKLKAQSWVEEALPEFYARAHDPRELLPAKAKLLEVVAKIAGYGAQGAMSGQVSGEKFSVTINLAGEQTLKVSSPNPQMIDVSDK